MSKPHGVAWESGDLAGDVSFVFCSCASAHTSCQLQIPRLALAKSCFRLSLSAKTQLFLGWS